MGHLHDLEDRLSSSWLHDKLGYFDQGSRRKLGNDTELVVSDNDTPSGTFKGGTKLLQLSGYQLQRGSWDLGQTRIVAIHQTIL